MSTKNKYHEVYIEVDKAGKGYVMIDGQKLKGARAVFFDAAANQPTTLLIEIIPAKIVVNAQISEEELAIVPEGEFVMLEEGIKND